MISLRFCFFLGTFILFQLFSQGASLLLPFKTLSLFSDRTGLIQVPITESTWSLGKYLTEPGPWSSVTESEGWSLFQSTRNWSRGWENIQISGYSRKGEILFEANTTLLSVGIDFSTVGLLFFCILDAPQTNRHSHKNKFRKAFFSQICKEGVRGIVAMLRGESKRHEHLERISHILMMLSRSPYYPPTLCKIFHTQ